MKTITSSIITVLLASVLASGMLAGCTGNGNNTVSSEADSSGNNSVNAPKSSSESTTENSAKVVSEKMIPRICILLIRRYANLQNG